MSKKSGLQSDPLDRMFERSKTEAQNEESQNKQTYKVANLQSNKVTQQKALAVPKYQQLDDRLNVLLTSNQVAVLRDFAKRVLNNRGKEFRKERITKNTVIRALIDLLPNLTQEINIKNIVDEKDLFERLKAVAVHKLTK
jgi:hypothetical protein